MDKAVTVERRLLEIDAVSVLASTQILTVTYKGRFVDCDMSHEMQTAQGVVKEVEDRRN